MQYSDESLQAIEGIGPERLWHFFYEISRIPRESGNEEGMRRYLLAFAKTHGIEALCDPTGNIVFHAGPTKGCEKIPSVALQGHMDMVCVKDEGVVHDFTKDPLRLRRDGDHLKAVGTTLGADNGIAIALILDLFSDLQAQHGPLEAIFTVSEETGLEGAFGLDASMIKSRLLLNLDSEEEGVFYIGCAGGVEVDATLPIEWKDIPLEDEQWSLVVDNLLGGHSGAEVDKQRANAIACSARFLRELDTVSTIRIASVLGGTKRNVIPSLCKTVFSIPKEDHAKALRVASQVLRDIQAEYAFSDPQANLTIAVQKRTCRKASSPAQSRKLIDALFITPYGVDRMSMSIPGLVETSSNLAVIRMTDRSFEIVTSQRSSIISSRDYITERTRAALETCGATCELQNPYPAWTPDINSPLAGLCTKTWKTFVGTPAKITAIHAGLECGIINSLIPGMDSVSIGPNLYGVHSTGETCSISSTARIAAFLRHLLITIQ